MLPGRSVLVVDSLEETREVLRSSLERRGVRILAASEPEQGLALARRHRPDLIVLDLECRRGQARASEELAAASLADETPLVLLGSARRAPASLPSDQFVSKPYHYGPLIRKIEELLEQARQPATRAG
ncbi:MAG TPA: response regulator [Pirellulales bacterium]|nr:response regulator [Pirellulales bacterium]